MATLELNATANVSSAVNGLNSIGTAAGSMSSDVTRAASSAATKMNSVGEAADGVGSRTSQAAGGVGDLAGGLQATGFISEKTAGSMGTAASAIQGLTGVMDLANLALTLQPVKWLAAKTQQVAYSVASKATAAAQWALNAAMAANPIGLVIIAIVALVAAFVVAYKKSETFRAIIDAAMSGVGKVVGFVVNLVVGYFRLWASVVTSVGSAITSGIARVLGFVTGIPGRVKDALSGAKTWLVSAGADVMRGLWNGLSSMSDWLAGKVTAMVSKVLPGPVKKVLGIASPSRLFRQYGEWTSEGLGIGIQDKAGMVERAASGLALKVAQGFEAPQLSLNATGSSPSSSSSDQAPIQITVQGAVDPTSTAKQIVELLRRYGRLTGVQVVPS